MSANVWSNIVGTLKGYLRLGLTGPRLKNSSGSLSVRNAGDTADAQVLPQSLGTGTRDGTKFLRDDGTWQVPSGASSSEYNAGNSGTSITIDFANGKLQKVTLTANTTITVTEPTAVGHYQLRLVQDGTGGRSLAFSGLISTRWIGATTQPSHNTDANGETLVTLYYDGADFIQGMSAINSGIGAIEQVRFYSIAEASASVGLARWYPSTDITISSVHFSLGVASSSSSTVIDVKKNGASIFSGTFPTATVGQNKSTVISGLSVSLSSSDYLTVDVSTGSDGQYLTASIVYS